MTTFLSQTRTVLILQSDRAAIFPLAAALRRAGWAVLSAEDATFAMSIARRQKPDAVVLNSQLAGGGGLTALKRLRSSAYTTLIPVICIVANNSGERAELAAAGAQEMIEPPGDPEAIAGALRRHTDRPATIMEVPPSVLGSPQRIAALQESGLLDSPPDEAFDRLLRLTTTLLDVPVALVAVIDKERQFFRSQVGLPQPFADSRQTPLSHSFCQWVVGGNEDLVVDDARKHPVLRTNLAIRDLGVIAYAGVPFSGGGETLGSFCAIDSSPRSWTEDQLTTLRDLSLVLQSYVTMQRKSQDRRENIDALGNGILGATRVLLRTGHDNAQTAELSRVIEQQAHRLVQVAS